MSAELECLAKGRVIKQSKNPDSIIFKACYRVERCLDHSMQKTVQQYHKHFRENSQKAHRARLHEIKKDF